MSKWETVKKFFWNPAPGSYFKNCTVEKQVYTGIYIQCFCGGNGYVCGESSCQKCNPMTEELTSKINEQFMRERGYDQTND